MHTSPNEYVLAFDFSLDRLDAALADPDGNWIIPHRAYANNMSGFQELEQDVLACLSGLDEASLTTTGKSTALFWWHAFRQIATDPDFAPYGPSLALLNPLHVPPRLPFKVVLARTAGHRGCRSTSLFSQATVFILFATSAWARIIPPDLLGH